MRTTKLLVFAMGVALVGTQALAAKTTSATGTPTQKSAATKAPPAPTPTTKECAMKLGLVTSTTSQGEDEYQSARQIVKKYGEACVVHYTYPDNFTQEQETMISNIVAMASDPKVKVIIIAQGVQGSIAAIRKVKQIRKDITFVVWEAHEKPSDIAAAADVVIANDNLSRGRTIIELAVRMGATHFVHYSFSRHMSYEQLFRRKGIMEAVCKKLGITFVYASAPDPLSEVGITGAQQYIMEDVGRQVAKYGKQAAFFTTNDALGGPVLDRAMHHGAIYTISDMNSPTIGYPDALGIKITPAIAGNYAEISKQIEQAVIKKGAAGRVGGVKVPSTVVVIKGMANLAFDTQGNREAVTDLKNISKYLVKEAGVDVALSPYPDAETKKDIRNFHQVLLQEIVYGEQYAKAQLAKKAAPSASTSKTKASAGSGQKTI